MKSSLDIDFHAIGGLHPLEHILGELKNDRVVQGIGHPLGRVFLREHVEDHVGVESVDICLRISVQFYDFLVLDGYEGVDMVVSLCENVSYQPHEHSEICVPVSLVDLHDQAVVDHPKVALVKEVQVYRALSRLLDDEEGQDKRQAAVPSTLVLQKDGWKVVFGKNHFLVLQEIRAG